MLSQPFDWDYTLKGLAVITADALDSVRASVREPGDCGLVIIIIIVKFLQKINRRIYLRRSAEISNGLGLIWDLLLLKITIN